MTLTISPTLAAFAAGAHRSPPRHLGTRYDGAGRFLREPGNTVVCHLVDGSPSEAAILAVRKRMMAMEDAGLLAFTPVRSLHMTLFQGIIEYRRTWPYWPRDVATDTPIDVMTRLFLERLADMPPCGAFSVAVSDLTPNGLTVVPATAGDAAALADWRDALADRLGYRHPDHETYVFHITLAYPIRWLDDARLPAWQALRDEALALFARDAPTIALRPPAFCRFADMEFFEELRVLDQRETREGHAVARH
jgi:hypothetical protein